MTVFAHAQYKEIAAVLASAREDTTDTQRIAAIQDMQERFVRLFNRDNPNFKPERFVAAATRAPGMHGRDRILR